MTEKTGFFETKHERLPENLPIFPLYGVLLLPGGNLPLNIFEDRYLEMIDDALKDSRLIGMVQPNKSASDNENGENQSKNFTIGCAGRITSFSETEDRRVVINLTGVCRFEIAKEMTREKSYRLVKPQWNGFLDDLSTDRCMDLDREKLFGFLERYFEIHGLSCSWESIRSTPNEKLITALAMICPLDACEKQALLEARTCQERAELFMTMLELSVHSQSAQNDNFPRH